MNRNRRCIFSKKIILTMVFCLTALCLLTMPEMVFCYANETVAAPDQAEGQVIHIVLDPGHGGSQPGAERGSVLEKDLNLKIACYLKEELESYEGVTVSLTRDDDETVELEERTEIALSEKADVLISLHNNSIGPCCPYDNGSTVLVAKGNYVTENEAGEQLALEEQKLGCNILNELESAGLTNQGLLLRDSEADERYEDGTLADYYAIIRNGVLNDLPSILIEHAFLDNDGDYETYLSNDDGLRTLARADARGIARYYQLTSKETGETLPELDDYQIKLVHVRDGRAENNDIIYQTYYVDEIVVTDDNRAVGGADNSVSANNRVAVDETEKDSTFTENNAVSDEVTEDGRTTDEAFSGEDQVTENREDSMVKKDSKSTFVIISIVVVIILFCAAGGALWMVCRRRK